MSRLSNGHTHTHTRVHTRTHTGTHTHTRIHTRKGRDIRARAEEEKEEEEEEEEEAEVAGYGCHGRGNIRTKPTLAARSLDGRLHLRVRSVDRRDDRLRRPEADQYRRHEETGRLHRRILPVRQPRAREPHRTRRHAFGQARR